MPDDHRARLLRAVRTADHPLDDDELSQRTGIRPRQTVNQVLRGLAETGVVRRSTGPTGKIVTYWVDDENTPLAIAAERDEPTRLDRDGAGPDLDRDAPRTRPAGSSNEQRDAERVMLDVLGGRLGRQLEPATIRLASGARVEVDGADTSHSVLVECWAHQGPPKGGQKHKVLADALKLTWIASTLYPRPELVLCMTDALAAAPFQPGSRSWAAQALKDLGVRIELVELPATLRAAVVAAQSRQYR